MIQSAASDQGVSLWQVTPENLLESVTSLYKGENSFRTLLDRSQGDARFEPIHRWSRANPVRRINPSGASAWSEDKATMHLELISAGIRAIRDSCSRRTSSDSGPVRPAHRSIPAALGCC